MIRSFKDKDTEAVFNGSHSRRLPTDIQRSARRRLLHLDSVGALEDLRQPPSNRFEALQGLQGRYSIRINDQWRITFGWSNGPSDVKIEDYH